VKPPNQLLSRKSDGEGVFDFDGILDREDDFNYEIALDSDVDSFYSDAAAFDHADNNNADDDMSASDGDYDSDDVSDDSEFSDCTYIQPDSSHTDMNDDCFSYDFEEDELSIEELSCKCRRHVGDMQHCRWISPTWGYHSDTKTP
jgi:hypothetical protein